MSRNTAARAKARHTVPVHPGPATDQRFHCPEPVPHADPRSRAYWPVGRSLLHKLQHVVRLPAASVCSAVATVLVLY